MNPITGYAEERSDPEIAAPQPDLSTPRGIRRIKEHLESARHPRVGAEWLWIPILVTSTDNQPVERAAQGTSSTELGHDPGCNMTPSVS
jgi:hypothetical protein